MRFFPDEASLLNAFAAGEISAINAASPTLLPKVAGLPQARLFTAPVARYTELLFNVSETGMTAVQQIGVRRALAKALDRDLLVDQVLNGQAIPLEGPYLLSSWAANTGLLTEYAPDVTAAQTELEAAGWSLSTSGDGRVREEENLVLRLLLLNTPTQLAVARVISTQWAAVGVQTTLQIAPSLSELQATLLAREFDVALLEILTAARSRSVRLLEPGSDRAWSQLCGMEQSPRQRSIGKGTPGVEPG